MTKIGYKTLLKISTNSASTVGSTGATTVGKLISIGEGPASQRAKVPTLVIDSTVFECEPGLPDDVSPMPITVRYKQGDAGFNKLKTMHAKGTVGLFYVVYNSTAMSDDWFKGFVQSLGRGAVEGNSQMSRTLSVQPTSGLHWAT